MCHGCCPCLQSLLGRAREGSVLAFLPGVGCNTDQKVTWVHVTYRSHLQGSQDKSPRQKPGVGAEARVTETLFTGWLALPGFTDLLFHAPQDHLPRVTPPRVDWVFPHKSLRKFPTDMSIDQSDRGNSLTDTASC